MNANELIEAYVADVAVHLPRRQRNDVAFELRALLHEELAGRAEAEGRPADEAMAVAFLQGFGRPEEVAARYRAPLVVIDPADGQAFLRASVIGLVVIWVLGLVVQLQAGAHYPGAWLAVLGRWWTGIVLPSLWWPGLMVVCFAAAAWARRRWPQGTQWQPRAREQIRGGRVAMVLALVGIACGLYFLADPTRVLDLFLDGRAAPAAYEALSYSERFRTRQGPWLFALLLLYIPLFGAVTVRGRWSPWLRRLETAHGLALAAVMLWTLVDGPVLRSPHGDGVVKLVLLLSVVHVVIGLTMRVRRRLHPAPGRGAQDTR
jgi:hypothetical protein